MNPTQTQRAVAALERQCVVRLVRIQRQLDRLRSRRRAVLEHHASVRQAMLQSSCWDSLACQVLAGFTGRGALAVCAIAAAGRDLWAAAEGIAAERRRWANLRVGLERRAGRPSRGDSWLA